MKLSKITLLLAAFGTVATASAAKGDIVGQPWVGEKPITESIGQIIARQQFAPKVNKDDIIKLKPIKPREVGVQAGDFGGIQSHIWPLESQFADAPEPRFSIGTSFQGPTSNDGGAFPPDTHGGVSPTQIFICINNEFRLYNKNGTQLFTVDPGVFFNSVRNGIGVSDPRVWYDRLTDRWFVCMINVSSPNRLMLAVSSSGTLTNTSSFDFYQFQQDLVTPTGDTGALLDYPCMGIDNQGIYIGGNMFGGGTPSLFVIRKSSVLSGGPIVASAFRGLSNISTPFGVNNEDPAATTGYVMGLGGTASRLNIRRVTNAATTPVLSGDSFLTIPVTGATSNFTPSGSTLPVDSLDRRFYSAQIRQNKISGTWSLWASHHCKVNSAGVGADTANGGDRIGSRWYQINVTNPTPSLVQAGTVFSSDATARHYQFSSVTSSGQGHAIVGNTTFSATSFLSVGGATRLRTDPLGTTSAPAIWQNSTSTYNIGSQSGRYRLGDYALSVVDPADDMTMWTFQEYCSATNVWAVRAIQLRAPAPASIASLTPNTITQGSTTNIVVNGTSTAGTEFFDPGTGYVNRLAAALSGTGLTVNSVTFNSPTQMTLNVTASAGAAATARNLTVTNPDGQVSTANGALTVVTAGNPVPSLTSINPAVAVTLTPGLNLSVSGGSFVSGAVVNWNGSPRTTTFVNATTLTAQLTPADLASATTASVTVTNPAPGGGTSGGVNFEVRRTRLTQTVTLEDHSNPLNLPVSVQIRNTGSTTALQTVSATRAGGTYVWELDIAPGTYDIATQGSTWLRKVALGVVTGSANIIGVTAVALKNGDCVQDNVVDLSDYTLIATQFNSVSTDPGWNPNADLNGDDVVDLTDYTIVAVNFNALGDD